MTSNSKKQNKTVLITGAAKRIGRNIAIGCALDGYDILLHANSSRVDAVELREYIVSLGVECEIIVGNLIDDTFVNEIFDVAKKWKARPVFALINCASIFEQDSARDFTIEQFESHQKINLLAPLLLSKNFFNQTEGQSGTIINILDQRVLKPNPLFFTYTLSKMGLTAATRTMAQEFAPNVRVNAIAPGPSIKNFRQSEADFEAQKNATLLKIGSPPEAITDAVLFLLSAKSVTGQIIAIDSGQSLVWQTPDIEGINE